MVKFSHPSTGLQKTYYITYFNLINNLKGKNLREGEQTIAHWEFSRNQNRFLHATYNDNSNNSINSVNSITFFTVQFFFRARDSLSLHNSPKVDFDASKYWVGKRIGLKDCLPRKTIVQGIENSYPLQSKTLQPFYYVESAVT